MVDVAFLVEGETEEILITHLKNIGWFESFNISIVSIINLKGNGNFCAKNIEKFIIQAKVFNPKQIILLTDLECDLCIEKTKNRLGDCNDCITVIARKAIESWILADTKLMRTITNNDTFVYDKPELTENMPFDTIVSVLKEHHVKGTGPSKPRFLKRMIKQGFDMNRANEHQNIDSLKYFFDKLDKLKEQ